MRAAALMSNSVPSIADANAESVSEWAEWMNGLLEAQWGWTYTEHGGGWGRRAGKICLAGFMNGSPPQHSCLENSMARGAWRAIVHGVTKIRTWLSVEHYAIHDFSIHARTSCLNHLEFFFFFACSFVCSFAFLLIYLSMSELGLCCCEGYLSLWWAGALSSRGVRASLCGGFSCCSTGCGMCGLQWWWLAGSVALWH